MKKNDNSDGKINRSKRSKKKTGFGKNAKKSFGSFSVSYNVCFKIEYKMILSIKCNSFITAYCSFLLGNRTSGREQPFCHLQWIYKYETHIYTGIIYMKSDHIYYQTFITSSNENLVK